VNLVKQEHADAAVSALDEDSRLLLSILLKRGNNFDHDLLREFYEQPTLASILKEIKRREGTC